MRALIDIEEQQIERLDELARRQKKSRAALIRHAVREYLDARNAENADGAFGLWRARAVDGLEYQERVRSEW
ncbi:ribbon-helix-helix protein, CopG family [Mesorhizobium marinum]|uniref:Ribbon-helix-helix protein, CopG family n=1 Tax=Mesorhizobium marinum TaxID=3228790 RepID=A0ABV3R2B9_9HYPH